MIFSLESTTFKETQKNLKKSTKEKFEKLMVSNEKKIEQRFSDTRGRTEVNTYNSKVYTMYHRY